MALKKIEQHATHATLFKGLCQSNLDAKCIWVFQAIPLVLKVFIAINFEATNMVRVLELCRNLRYCVPCHPVGSGDPSIRVEARQTVFLDALRIARPVQP
jgi:hypothetical protein